MIDIQADKIMAQYADHDSTQEKPPFFRKFLRKKFTQQETGQRLGQSVDPQEATASQILQQTQAKARQDRFGLPASRTSQKQKQQEQIRTETADGDELQHGGLQCQ